MYTFLYKKNINFLSNSFLFNLYDVHIWSIGLARNHEHLHNKTVDFYPIHPINAQNLQTLITFSVLLQLKDLISENMKISK